MFQTKMQKEPTPKMDNGMKLVKKIRKSLLEIKIFLTRSKKVLLEIFSEELLEQSSTLREVEIIP
jgi:hypothetical protein